MYNMKWESQGGTGSQLRITYFAEQDLYKVEGYIVRKDSNERSEYIRIGERPIFNSLQEALDYIVNHQGAKHGHAKG